MQLHAAVAKNCEKENQKTSSSEGSNTSKLKFTLWPQQSSQVIILDPRPFTKIY